MRLPNARTDNQDTMSALERSPRSTMVRSLSLPFSIEEYQKEIRQLEDRMLSGVEHSTGVGILLGTGGSNEGNGQTLRRSLSAVVGKIEDGPEEILLRKNGVVAGSAQEDFLVGQGYEASTSVVGHFERDVLSEGSFLPGFASMKGLQIERERSLSNSSSSFPPAASFSSTRDLPIEPIVEETAETAEDSNIGNSRVEEDDKERAAETIFELARIFELPFTPTNTDSERSPISVRELWGDSTMNKSETNVVNANQAKTSGDVSICSPLRRSIFGSRSENERGAPSHSFSSFGIFSFEHHHSGTTLPSASDKIQQPQQHTPEFRVLTESDRANSLPARLPRKSSMKRIPSVQSADTTGSESSMLSASARLAVKRNVSFGKLETREYSIALSDHPSCSFGPPISLGWDFRDKEAVSLDDYEEGRSPRRSMHEMLLSYNVRRYLLLKRAGYTHDELEQAMNEVDRVKRERLVTDLLLPASHLDETFENVMRHLKRVFGGVSSSAD